MHPQLQALIEHYKFQPLLVKETLLVSTYRSQREIQSIGFSLKEIYPI
jgi:hypothetical protein